MTTVGIKEIQQNLLSWLQRVEAGEEVVISNDDIPIVQMIPVPKDPPQLRPIGLCQGEFSVPDDFDAPLPEAILQSFEGQ